MDFSVIFQLRTKKFWWMDVIFYFVISLLVATVLCYFIFLIKNNFQRTAIEDQMLALETVGTAQQKVDEKEVLSYKGKIADFSALLEKHGFASNAFVLMQTRTMPNIWYKQFNLDAKNNGLQLSGEADDLDSLSRQIAVFEAEDNKKYIKNIGTLNSSLGQSARTQFNINLVLDQNIFSYLSSITPISGATAPSDQSSSSVGPIPPNMFGYISNLVSTTATISPTDQPLIQQNNEAGATQAAPIKSREKEIILFKIILDKEYIGIIDKTNRTISLTVPAGTNLTNITPFITLSPKATVLPPSGALQNFTNPVTYITTAEDGSIQSYAVKIIYPVITQAPANNNSSQSWLSIMIIAIIAVIIIVVAVIISAVLKRIKRTQ